jgi:hypothetical protein
MTFFDDDEQAFAGGADFIVGNQFGFDCGAVFG